MVSSAGSASSVTWSTSIDASSQSRVVRLLDSASSSSHSGGEVRSTTRKRSLFVSPSSDRLSSPHLSDDDASSTPSERWPLDALHAQLAQVGPALSLADQPLSNDGAALLAHSLSTQPRMTLDLSHNDLAYLSTHSIARLADALGNCHALRSLCLAGNDLIADDLSRLLAMLPPLLRLDLAQNTIRSAEHFIVDLLRSQPTLVELNLSGCEISTAELLVIMQAVRSHPALHDLKLASNLFTEKFTPPIANCVASSPLRALDLRGNCMTDQKIEAVLSMLASSAPIALHTLDLRANFITRQSIDWIGRALRGQPQLNMSLSKHSTRQTQAWAWFSDAECQKLSEQFGERIHFE